MSIHLSNQPATIPTVPSTSSSTYKQIPSWTSCIVVCVCNDTVLFPYDSHRVELSLEACLDPYLDCFTCSTTQWGLITDLRDDGSTYQRHGVVVELHADLTRPLSTASADDELLLRRLRHAVDLVKLTLAVDPLAVKPLLLRRSKLHQSVGKYERDLNLTPEELCDLARRDVPFELRLRLELEATALDKLHSIGVSRFTQTLDEAQADRTDALRRYLVGQGLRSASARRLQRLPVRTVLAVACYDRNPDAWGPCNRRLEDLADTTGILQFYQTRRGPLWQLEDRRAPLSVQRVDLRLGVVPLISSNLKAASKHVVRGLPMHVSNVTLDVRFMDCEEDELQAFLEAITTNCDQIAIDTGSDCDGERRVSKKILMVLRCVGCLPHNASVDLSGLLAVAQSRVNRLAAIHGLVQYILPRSSHSTRLTIRGVLLSDQDARDITESDYSLRQDQPGVKLRLESLELWSEEDSVNGFRALLAALDDVAEISLHTVEEFFETEDVKWMLHFPSLRSLDVTNLSIATMDVFSSVAEIQLKNLELAGLQLSDSASLVAFVKSLNPQFDAASPLAWTLESLSVTERVHGGYEDDDEPNVRRAVNDIAVVAALEEVLPANETLRLVNFIGNYADLPVTPASETEYVGRRSLIPAPKEIRRSALEMARKAAFLSGIRDGNCTPARQLDSNIIGIVFEYSAPLVVRKVRA